MTEASVAIVITNPTNLLDQVLTAYHQLWRDAGCGEDLALRKIGEDHLDMLFRLHQVKPGEVISLSLTSEARLRYHAPGLDGGSDLKLIAVTKHVAWMTFRDLFQKTFMVSTAA